MVFDIVAAGEVHPQPQFLMFGNVLITIFLWWVPSFPVVQPQVTRSSSLLLLVMGKWMNSEAWLHCSSILFNEQWSMLHCSREQWSMLYYSGRTGPVQI
jgi:hypothetical protein